MSNIMKQYDGQTLPPFKQLDVDDLMFVKSQLICRKNKIDERLKRINRVIGQKRFESEAHANTQK